MDFFLPPSIVVSYFTFERERCTGKAQKDGKGLLNQNSSVRCKLGALGKHGAYLKALNHQDATDSVA